MLTNYLYEFMYKNPSGLAVFIVYSDFCCMAIIFNFIKDECIMTISVNATTINMTRGVGQAIEEGSMAVYVCETDCAYPDPPSVSWYVDDKPVGLINGQKDPTNNFLSCKDYNGQKTISTLQLKTKREMNKKIVKCVLDYDDTKFSEHNLNITCKYLLVHISQVKI